MMFAAALVIVALANMSAVLAQLATVYGRCNAPNVVALTFDDGPYIYESQLVQRLNQEGIKATFFVNGNNWRCIYDGDMVSSMRAAYASGHEFGSHTWHHRNLATLSWDNIHDEMWRTELALQRILGVNPALMRPPYGAYNDLVRQAAAVRNQSLVMWDFDSGDSTGSTADQSKQAYNNLAAQRPASILTLNHETYFPTVNDVVPAAISTLRNAGYRFVTVSECLGVRPYQWVAAPQQPTGDWNCNV